MPVHDCPVCGEAHEVHPVLHALAYGRQLACSPRCKQAFAELCRSRLWQTLRDDAYSGQNRKADKEPAC